MISLKAGGRLYRQKLPVNKIRHFVPFIFWGSTSRAQSVFERCGSGWFRGLGCVDLSVIGRATSGCVCRFFWCLGSVPAVPSNRKITGFRSIGRVCGPCDLSHLNSLSFVTSWQLQGCICPVFAVECGFWIADERMGDMGSSETRDADQSAVYGMPDSSECIGSGGW